MLLQYLELLPVFSKGPLPALWLLVCGVAGKAVLLFLTFLLQNIISLQLACPKVFLLNINEIVLNILFESFLNSFFIHEVKNPKNPLISHYHIQNLKDSPEFQLIPWIVV